MISTELHSDDAMEQYIDEEIHAQWCAT